MPPSDTPDTKIEITVSLVGRLVAAQFPEWAGLPITPIEFLGWDNRTLRLGPGMSVRMPSAERYSTQVKKEQQWLPVLAPLLPLPIPVPLAMGLPSDDYPWNWSVYRWLQGESATIERIDDLQQFAVTLAGFLAALQQIDPADGPPPGQHNFFRGGPLSIYDTETRNSIAALRDIIDTEAVTAVWDASLAAPWNGRPACLHGDICAANLLIDGGRLSAVIDFGCSGVGDPACDLAIAWTLFSRKSREAFFAALPVDAATRERGRGWALWKALIVLAEHRNTNPLIAGTSPQVIDRTIGSCN